MISFALTGCRIFTGEVFLEEYAVVIEGERITAVVPRSDVNDVELRNLEGGLLAPGFIDVQVNGGGGALLNDNPRSTPCEPSHRRTRRFGTVGMLPTVITDAPHHHPAGG